jgi:hypothetical protein
MAKSHAPVTWTDTQTRRALDWADAHAGHQVVMEPDHDPERGRRALRCDTCRVGFYQTALTAKDRAREYRRARTEALRSLGMVRNRSGSWE